MRLLRRNHRHGRNVGGQTGYGGQSCRAWNRLDSDQCADADTGNTVGDKHKNVTWSFRYINPDANIRLAAGRALLTNDGESAFQAGASASITGNMLTTVACATIRSDRRLLEDLGRDVTPEYWKEEKSEA